MAAKPARRPAAPTRPAARRAPLVLLVDDVPDNRMVYSMWLDAAGFRTAEASTGEEALEFVGRMRPDIVVMDLSLPQMDGWEATRRIKQDPASRGIPVVALTGFALGEHAHRAREAGCDVVITKPCLPEDLEKVLRDLLGRASEEPRRRT